MRSGGGTLKILGSVLGAGSNGAKDGLLDVGGVVVETHVSQHHHGGEQQSSGVSKTLASNVGSGSVDGLEDGDLVTHVTGGGQTKTTDKTGGKIGQNVTVKVGHDHDDISVESGVLDHSQTGVVDQLDGKVNGGVLLGELSSNLKEKTIGDLHNRGLVDNKDLLHASGQGVLVSVPDDSLGSLSGDQLDGLNDTGDDGVLDTGVLTLSVLSDEQGVDVLVRGLVAHDGLARSDVGEQVEGSSQSQVHGNVALTDGGGEGTLEGNLVSVDGLNGAVGDGGLAVDQSGGDVDNLPVDGDLGGMVDVLDSLGDLGSDTVSLNQRHSVLAVGVLLAGERGHGSGVGSGLR